MFSGACAKPVCPYNFLIWRTAQSSHRSFWKCDEPTQYSFLVFLTPSGGKVSSWWANCGVPIESQYLLPFNSCPLKSLCYLRLFIHESTSHSEKCAFRGRSFRRCGSRPLKFSQYNYLQFNSLTRVIDLKWAKNESCATRASGHTASCYFYDSRILWHIPRAHHIWRLLKTYWAQGRPMQYAALHYGKCHLVAYSNHHSY